MMIRRAIHSLLYLVLAVFLVSILPDTIRRFPLENTPQGFQCQFPDGPWGCDIIGDSSLPPDFVFNRGLAVFLPLMELLLIFHCGLGAFVMRFPPAKITVR